MVRHFTTEQRAWIVARKLQGDSIRYPGYHSGFFYSIWCACVWIWNLQADYTHFWPMNTWYVINAPPPASKKSLRDPVKNFRDHGTCQDRRRKRKAEREGIMSVLTQQNIDDVSWIFFNSINANLYNQVWDEMDVESARNPTDPGSSVRRNRFFNRF